MLKDSTLEQAVRWTTRIVYSPKVATTWITEEPEVDSRVIDFVYVFYRDIVISTNIVGRLPLNSNIYLYGSVYIPIEGIFAPFATRPQCRDSRTTWTLSVPIPEPFAFACILESFTSISLGYTSICSNAPSQKVFIL